MTGRAPRLAGCAVAPEPHAAARPRRRRGASPRSSPSAAATGLSASLAALRRITGDLTAVVTVADDGGSSGRLRDELGVLPPGDLRKALAALCGDDDWGQTWARVIQHRFVQQGELHGHAVGNLLIVALWEQLGDQVPGPGLVGRLLGAHGRVLPMSAVPAGPPGAGAGPRPGARRRRGHDRPRPGRPSRSPPARCSPCTLVPARPAGRPGGRRSGAGRRLGGARAGLLVLLGDPAPAGARAARRAHRDQGPPGALPEPRAATRRNRGLLPAASFGGFGTTRP